jgi:hypothetical protein
MKDCEGVDQLHNITNVDGCGRSPTLLHLRAHRTQIIRGDLRQKPITKSREDVPLVDGAAHRPGAIRHLRLLQPALSKFPEALCLFEATLFALLLASGREALRYRALRIDKLLPCPS